MDLFSAQYHANLATRYFIQAEAFATATGIGYQPRIDFGVQELRLAAKALGYTLTPISADPQAEHEAALSRRIAENGPEVFNDPRNEEAA